MVAAFAHHPGSAWADPFAGFTHDPQTPLTHQPVNFTSEATTDAGATIVSQEWDLDGDGKFDEGTDPTATFTYTRPGTRQVALRVSDDAGGEDTHRESIVIGNRAPAVSFVPIPSSPQAGETVTLHSTSSDSDGFIAGHAWDLDNDGSFDDANGSTAGVVFPATGLIIIGLRVVDDAGAASAVVLGITQGATFELPGTGQGTGAGTVTGPAAPSVVALRARLLSPFPIVRVSGIVRKRGIRLRMLSVNSPLGAIVKVRCRGRGCPFRQHSRTVVSPARSTATPGSGLVRIRRFRHRLLRAGAAVKVYVTRPDAIGKYTRLRVREGKPPARIDRCVWPGNRLPIACPTD